MTKKLNALFLVSLLLITINGCGTTTQNSDTTPTTETTDQIERVDNPQTGMDDVVEEVRNNRMKLQIGDTVLTAILVQNSTTDALKEILAEGSITIDMRDYGNMEKVGSLGTSLPRNDEQITTKAGDLILYQGNAFVIYYAPNSWNFTRIGKIDDITPEELKKVLGPGDVTVTLSMD